MDKIAFLERMERMSEEDYQKTINTDEYRALLSGAEPAVRKKVMSVMKKRNADNAKRAKLLEALYTNPKVLEWLKAIEDYRSLRVEQAWISIAIREGDGDKKRWETLDRQRRTVHNRALAAFCRLIEFTSPYSTRDNIAPDGNPLFMPRDESNGDLYAGPLMIPSEEQKGYGNPKVREAMTDGMFELLKLIEETPRSDWDRIREGVKDKLKGRATIEPTPDIMELQSGLKRITRGYGMSEAPGEDDFSTDLFDDRDNKYKKDKGYNGWEFD